MVTRDTAVWVSVVICLMAALIEGLCAGRTVRPFSTQLQFPRYSPPLRLWSVIGAAYYLVFGFVLYRVLSQAPRSTLATSTLALTGLIMLGNALANLVIFRVHNLRRSRSIGDLYAVLDVLLVLLVARLDVPSAWALSPYVAYRAYAVWWGHALATLNRLP